MLATQASIFLTKHALSTTAKHLSDDDVDDNFVAFQNIPPLPPYQIWDVSPLNPNPRHKRSRLNQSLDRPPVAEGFCLGGAVAIDDQCRPNATRSPFGAPYRNMRSPTGKSTQVNPKINGFGGEQSNNVLPNALNTSRFEGMPYPSPAARNPNLSSNAGRGKSTSSHAPSNRSNGFSSRRRRLPGENLPRLASTWRLTTSPRGSDNLLSARSHTKGNTPRTFTSGSTVVTDGGAFETGYDTVSGDLSAGGAFETAEQYHSAATNETPFEADMGSFNYRAIPRSFYGLSSPNSWNDASATPMQTFPNSGSEMSFLSPSWQRGYSPVISTTESILGPYQASPASSASSAFGTPSHDSVTSSQDWVSILANESLEAGTAHSNVNCDVIRLNFLDPTPAVPEEPFTTEQDQVGAGLLPWNTQAVAGTNFDADNNTNIPGIIPDSDNLMTDSLMNFDPIDPFMLQKGALLDFGVFENSTQLSLQETNTNLMRETPLQNTEHSDHYSPRNAWDTLSDFDFDFQSVPSGERRLVSHTQHPFFSAGLSTGSLLGVDSQRGRWQAPRQYKHIYGESLPPRSPSPTALSLGLSTSGTELAVPLSADRSIPNSTDAYNNCRNNDVTDFEVVVFDNEEIEPKRIPEPSEMTRSLSNVNCRQWRSSPPPQIHGQPGSIANVQLSNCKDSSIGGSPILVLVEDTNDTQQDTQDILTRVNQKPKSKESRNLSASTQRKIAWEHTFVVQDDFVEAEWAAPIETALEKRSGRKGPLRENSRKGAKVMRKHGCCLRCRFLRVKCSDDKICEPCTKVIFSPFTGSVCPRDRFRDYVNVFLAEPAVRPFQQALLDKFIREKCAGHNSNAVAVDLSSGPTYPSFRLTVHEFYPTDPSLLFFKTIVADAGTNISKFVNAYSPPLGIIYPGQNLKSTLMNHIQRIIKGERNYGEVIYGDTSQLTWEVFEAVRLYQRANPENQFLQKLMKLYAMQSFMSTSITLLRDSAAEILDSLPRPRPSQHLYTKNPSVYLVNIEVKIVMLSLMQETYLDILEELERALCHKGPALWAPTFCCIMILCMCAEIVQTTTDLRIVNSVDDKAKSATGPDKNDNSMSRDDSIAVCRRLDDLPIASAMNSFHLVYRTNKPTRDGSKRDDNFNPIAHEIDTKTKDKMSYRDQDFVARIRSIVNLHRNDLKFHASTPSFNSNADLVSDHENFRKRNNGRLVGTFLSSML